MEGEGEAETAAAPTMVTVSVAKDVAGWLGENAPAARSLPALAQALRDAGY